MTQVTDFGSFMSGLGQGIVNIFGGIGNSIDSTGNYNNAVAAQVRANAEITDDILEAQREQQSREAKLVIVALVLITIVPVMGALMISKK